VGCGTWLGCVESGWLGGVAKTDASDALWRLQPSSSQECAVPVRCTCTQVLPGHFALQKSSSLVCGIWKQFWINIKEFFGYLPDLLMFFILDLENCRLFWIKIKEFFGYLPDLPNILNYNIMVDTYTYLLSR